ncbi:MAG TPA: adenosylcobinamide-GDP ribazoletransferase [Pseudomonadales bacterium]|nr:adenosylcobinamide-GDP ribazoletransferase [Pseudomonadales bacterium]
MTLSQYWQQFLMAVMFLTRLPVSSLLKYDPALSAGMARFFPLVGWLVGSIAALILWLCAQYLPWLPAVIIATALTILATGAFHEDGFADMCDAFGGGWEKEQVLLIMKDSRLGTYGTLGLGLILASKISLLASLPISTALGALAAGHVLSRTAATSLLLSLPYVRDTEDPTKIKTPISHFTGRDLLFILITAIPALCLLPVGSWLSVIISQLAVRYWAAWYYTKRIGGYTGDCLGGAQQLGELGVLIVVSCFYHG